MRRDQQRERGFTLVELMITVVIVGILAALASWGVIKYVRISKSSEATSMIGSIKSSEEAYRAEMFFYLDVSGNNAISASSYYPSTSTAGQKARSWLEVAGSETTIGLAYKRLGVQPAEAVRFIYATAAGKGDQTPAGHQMQKLKVTNWPAAPTGQPWYVISAKGDMDGDTYESRFAGASFTGQILSEDEGE